ncbi:hypothetical protein MC7420_6444 [Coleofasciculus chthonoplastes PCC 7420]|uniref:Uncharacterized protein n=1 Tax=Coleofasciculus chthonoplastes PCC 7420 TaxID=118168 RepID=B4VQT4_9CYAN|nr:hypothetical protein [Coleofasciculus chthonoplastes]EDX75789.1 hypothetical protein MC7420_6444 [Coleofasciculus chthonoplastes PCC 7420]
MNTDSTRTQQIQQQVNQAIASLKSQGIHDWEILDTWSKLLHQQGNYAAADTLASAAYELGVAE